MSALADHATFLVVPGAARYRNDGTNSRVYVLKRCM